MGKKGLCGKDCGLINCRASDTVTGYIFLLSHCGMLAPHTGSSLPNNLCSGGVQFLLATLCDGRRSRVVFRKKLVSFLGTVTVSKESPFLTWGVVVLHIGRDI